jgi:hypothetical protein
MGNTQSMRKINYEDMQIVIKCPELYLLINTLPLTDQSCLIINTMPACEEERIINKFLLENKNIRIIIYGKNCIDESVNLKYKQLYSLGFCNIFVYLGGLFEWLMLQDIYGTDLFPTTKKEADILKYKPLSTLTIGLIDN